MSKTAEARISGWSERAHQEYLRQNNNYFVSGDNLPSVAPLSQLGYGERVSRRAAARRLAAKGASFETATQTPEVAQISATAEAPEMPVNAWEAMQDGSRRDIEAHLTQPKNSVVASDSDQTQPVDMYPRQNGTQTIYGVEEQVTDQPVEPKAKAGGKGGRIIQNTVKVATALAFVGNVAAACAAFDQEDDALDNNDPRTTETENEHTITEDAATAVASRTPLSEAPATLTPEPTGEVVKGERVNQFINSAFQEYGLYPTPDNTPLSELYGHLNDIKDLTIALFGYGPEEEGGTLANLNADFNNQEATGADYVVAPENVEVVFCNETAGFRINATSPDNTNPDFAVGNIILSRTQDGATEFPPTRAEALKDILFLRAETFTLGDGEVSSEVKEELRCNRDSNKIEGWLGDKLVKTFDLSLEGESQQTRWALTADHPLVADSDGISQDVDTGNIFAGDTLIPALPGEGYTYSYNAEGGRVMAVNGGGPEYALVDGEWEQVQVERNNEFGISDGEVVRIEDWSVKGVEINGYATDINGLVMVTDDSLFNGERMLDIASEVSREQAAAVVEAVHILNSRSRGTFWSTDQAAMDYVNEFKESEAELEPYDFIDSNNEVHRIYPDTTQIIVVNLRGAQGTEMSGTQSVFVDVDEDGNLIVLNYIHDEGTDPFYQMGSGQNETVEDFRMINVFAALVDLELRTSSEAPTKYKTNTHYWSRAIGNKYIKGGKETNELTAEDELMFDIVQTPQTTE